MIKSVTQLRRDSTRLKLSVHFPFIKGAAIDLINSGLFSHGDTGLFRSLTDHLLYHDEYLLMADYRAYVDCQQEVDHAFCDTAHWTRMSILNVARMGKFSSDRAVREYAKDIWHLDPLREEE